MTSMKERLTEELKLSGWNRVPTMDSRYDTWEHPEKPFRLFLGEEGEFRSGKSVGDSAPNDGARARLLGRWEGRKSG